MADLPIQCRCGAFQAVVHDAGPRHGNRVVCYCTWCQAFAKFLGREAEILDPHGGTDICQVSPGRLEILRGADQLACVHLSRAPTLRWYTACCKSPIGNTLNTPKKPFLGLINWSVDTSTTPGGLDELLGPVRARVNGSGARGDTSGLNIHKSAPLSLYWRAFRLVLGGRMSGEYKKSPLFNHDSGRPVVEPTRVQTVR